MEREASPWALEPRDVQSPDAMGSPEGSPKGEGGNALRGAGDRGEPRWLGGERSERVGLGVLCSGGEGRGFQHLHRASDPAPGGGW